MPRTWIPPRLENGKHVKGHFEGDGENLFIKGTQAKKLIAEQDNGYNSLGILDPGDYPKGEGAQNNSDPNNTTMVMLANTPTY